MTRLLLDAVRDGTTAPIPVEMLPIPVPSGLSIIYFWPSQPRWTMIILRVFAHCRRESTTRQDLVHLDQHRPPSRALAQVMDMVKGDRVTASARDYR